MSRPQVPADEAAGRQLISMLASNPVAFGNLIAYGELRLAQEEQVLNQMAVKALMNQQDRDGAVLQYGRVTMLRDLLIYARTFQKK